jgi:hypothetical protein
MRLLKSSWDLNYGKFWEPLVLRGFVLYGDLSLKLCMELNSAHFCMEWINESIYKVAKDQYLGC